jgi:hypothetical protein
LVIHIARFRRVYLPAAGDLKVSLQSRDGVDVALVLAASLMVDDCEGDDVSVGISSIFASSDDVVGKSTSDENGCITVGGTSFCSCGDGGIGLCT